MKKKAVEMTGDGCSGTPVPLNPDPTAISSKEPTTPDGVPIYPCDIAPGGDVHLPMRSVKHVPWGVRAQSTSTGPMLRHGQVGPRRLCCQTNTDTSSELTGRQKATKFVSWMRSSR